MGFLLGFPIAEFLPQLGHFGFPLAVFFVIGAGSHPSWGVRGPRIAGCDIHHLDAGSVFRKKKAWHIRRILVKRYLSLLGI